MVDLIFFFRSSFFVNNIILVFIISPITFSIYVYILMLDTSTMLKLIYCSHLKYAVCISSCSVLYSGKVQNNASIFIL